MITQTDVRIQYTKEDSISYDSMSRIPRHNIGNHFDSDKIAYIVWLETKLIEEWNRKE